MTRVVEGRLIVLIFLGLLGYTAWPAQGADIEKGKKIYEEKRCGMCHAIGGQGGKVGPDLADVGSKRDRDWLVKFLKDPKGTVSGAKMMPVKATDEEITALVDYLLSLKK